MSKTFFNSKKMNALVLVAVVSSLKVFAFLWAAMKQPEVVNSVVLEMVVLTYGGAFAAAATAAITTQGIIGDKQDAAAKIAALREPKKEEPKKEEVI